MSSLNIKTTETHGYAPVNGLKMYYEIEGAGETLVYIPPRLRTRRVEIISGAG